MADAKGFDLAAMLKEVSNPDTGSSGVLQMIPAYQIYPNEKNFYDVSDVDGLIDAILMDGLQSPLVVNQTSPDSYTIISGHRRLAALSWIISENLDIAPGKLFAAEISSGRIPCLVNVYASDLQAELALIRANSDTRILSSAEKAEQIKRTEDLLYQLKEQGYPFPGKMRDYVAEVCQVSASKIARLKVIREKLTHEFCPAYKTGELGESVAYALAQLPIEHQQKIFRLENDKRGNFRNLYEHRVRDLAGWLSALDERVCKSRSCDPCINKDGKWRHVSGRDYYYGDCHEKCCSDCSELGSCRHACPKLAKKVKQIKADRREAKRQEELAQEAKDAPKIQLIQNLWLRFGIARTNAHKTVKESLTAMDIYYGGQHDDAKYQEMENLLGKVTASTAPPFGYSWSLDVARALTGVADLFDCSVDYLLCRTDSPKGIEAAPIAAPPTVTPVRPGLAWYPTSVEPHIGQEIIAVNAAGYAEDARYVRSGEISGGGLLWDEVALWTPFPTEPTTIEELPEDAQQEGSDDNAPDVG